MSGLLRIPAVEVSIIGADTVKQYMLSTKSDSIDINSITIMEIYDENTGDTINEYMVLNSGESHNKCRKCAFSVYKKDRISGVCTRAKSCRGNDLIFLSVSSVLEDL